MSRLPFESEGQRSADDVPRPPPRVGLEPLPHVEDVQAQRTRNGEHESRVDARAEILRIRVAGDVEVDVEEDPEGVAAGDDDIVGREGVVAEPDLVVVVVVEARLELDRVAEREVPEPDRAEVQVIVYMEEGAPKFEKMRLVKEQGVWKIDSYPFIGWG